MKPIKAILLAAGMCAVFPLLIAHAKSQSQSLSHAELNIPYQIHTFDFDQTLVPDSKDYQKKWQRMTGFEHSGLHWEQFVVVYTNKGSAVYKHNFLQYSAWFDDPEDEDNEPQYQTYPTGTAFIKENYKIANGKPHDFTSVTVMIKRKPGFNPAGGDWEYLQFNQNGKQIIRGKGSDQNVNNVCADCHSNVAQRDFIFSNIYSGASQ